MIIKQVVAPSVEPVTVDEVKTQLIIDGNDLDAEVAAMIAPARQLVEQMIGRALITQTWDRWYDAFPAVMSLPWAPLQSVTAITYVNTDGAEQTLSPDVYTVDADSEPGRVYLAYGQSWPSTRAIPKAVKVRFVAGFGDTSDDVPACIKLAIMLLVGSLMNNREDDAPIALHKVPWGVKSLLADHRMYRRAC